MKRNLSDQNVLVVFITLFILIGSQIVVFPAWSVDYPFADDMEDPNITKSNWTSEEWDLVNDSHSGSSAWTDSPGGNYIDGAEAALTLASDLDLRQAVNPQLTFWHHYVTESSRDKCRVQISREGGALDTYETLETYSGNQSNWKKIQLDLSLYADSTSVRIRFILTSDGSVRRDGWYIDDVNIGDSVPDITLDSPSNITMHSVDLSWSSTNNPQFARYDIYRGTTSDVSYSDTLVGEIEDALVTTYRDEYTILEPSTYWYRIYVLSKQDIYSRGSNAAEARYTIPKVDYPFADDLEQGTDNWEWSAPWGLTNESAHSAETSWTDSPGGASPNNVNTALTLRIDLRQAEMPLLRFWHRYSFEPDADYGYVEISTNQGANWAQLSHFTDLLRDWSEVRVDLASYANETDVHIRFRLETNDSITYDGWYIDDIRIEENGAQPTFPFFDDMENQNTIQINWFAPGWDTVRDSHSGQLAWTDSPKGNYSSNIQTSLTLATPIDLRRTIRPQLAFWHHFHTEKNDDKCQIQVSTDLGKNYMTVATYSGEQKEWTQAQVDLSPYTGLPKVRIRFLLTSDRSSQYDGWYIDDFRIDEALSDVFLNELMNVSMHGATLNWSAATDPGFARYEIYRSLEANVTRSHLLVASIDDSSVTSYRDEYAVLEPDYYRYRVYVIGEQGIASLGSNVVEAHYSIPKVNYPFTDDLESGTGNWSWSAPWTLSDQFAHSGRTAWTDSPEGGYENNANSALTLRIDLDKATAPGLQFQQRYSFDPNADYGYVELSNDQGKTWETLTSITGYQGDWANTFVDLSDYAAQFDVHIRFRVETNDSVVFDGWYIDDIRIEEDTSRSILFWSDMEDQDATQDKWVTNSWGPATPGYKSGTAWNDSPGGEYLENSKEPLTLSNPLDFTTVVNPRLVFWHVREMGDGDTCSVQVSTTGPDTDYKTVAAYSGGEDWKEELIDLSVYAGSQIVWVRFVLETDASGRANGWSIDNVKVIGSQPTTAINLSPSHVIIQPNTTQQFMVSESASMIWSVNDVIGGDEKVGTISETGLYTAPQVVPNPATIEIRATEVSNPATSAAAMVTISESVNPRGDANGDGKVDLLDITTLERIIVGLESVSPSANPDVDGDNIVTIYDITKLERILAGLDKPIPAPSIHMGNPQLSLIPLTVESNIVVLGLKAEGIRNLDTIYFQITSDQPNIHILSVNSGTLVPGATPVINLEDNGMKGIVAMNIPGLHGVNGSGTLAEVRIGANSRMTSQSSITVSKLALGDTFGQRIPIDTTRLGVTLPESPKHTELLQNFPNPFNPETWIPYRLAESARVRISIHESTGRLVREMNIGLKRADSYLGKEQAARWDGRNEAGELVGSGIYFYTIRAGEYTATKKLTILR